MFFDDAADDLDEFSQDILEKPHYRYFLLDRPAPVRPKKWDEMKARIWRIRFNISRAGSDDEEANFENENNSSKLLKEQEEEEAVESAANLEENAGGNSARSGKRGNPKSIRKSSSQESVPGNTLKSAENLPSAKLPNADALERLRLNNIDESRVLSKIQELKEQKREYFNQFRKLINEGEKKKQLKISEKQKQNQQEKPPKVEEQQKSTEQVDPAATTPALPAKPTPTDEDNDNRLMASTLSSPRESPIKNTGDSFSRFSSKNVVSNAADRLQSPARSNRLDPVSPPRRIDTVSHRYHPYGGGSAPTTGPYSPRGASSARPYHSSSSLLSDGSHGGSSQRPFSPHHPSSSSASISRGDFYGRVSQQHRRPSARPDPPSAASYQRSSGRPPAEDHMQRRPDRPQTDDNAMKYRPSISNRPNPVDMRRSGGRPMDDSQRRRSYNQPEGSYGPPQDRPENMNDSRPTMGYRRGGGSGYGYSRQDRHRNYDRT